MTVLMRPVAGDSADNAPTLSRPPSESAQVPRSLHRALMILYILLALSCIILMALVLVKISESVRECQNKNQGWSSVWQLIMENINVVKRDVQSESEKMKTLLTDMNQIKNKLQEISKALETKPSS
nr:mast cell-expressed membrane protein 1 [Mirounga angustirostris]